MVTTKIHKRKKSTRYSQSGSVFFYIFLGVALFGALAYAITRGVRTQTTSALTTQQSRLAASDILNYAQLIERAVQKIRLKGCSESDISFAHDDWPHTQYEHTPTAPDKCKIFHPDGGGMNFIDMQSQHSDYINTLDRFIFVGRSAINNVGTTCAADQCVELYLFVRMYHAENICTHLNKIIGISQNLPISGGIFGGPRFNGTFTYGNTLTTGAFDGEKSGCYQDNSETYTDGTPYYDFYHVLLER